MIDLDLQSAVEDKQHPSLELFSQWVDTALSHTNKDWELTIRIVSNEESQELNNQYRGKDKPTNVLSFPFEVPEGIEINLLGDLVISQQVVIDEAKHQGKSVNDHWAHMVIHGCLHLLGYDHIDDDEAIEMESLETKLLATLSIADPYNDA